MQYAVYLRKSRADLDAEAMGQGETLARHRAALLGYAQSHGMEIGAVYEEIVSGESIEARPKMKRLLQEVAQRRWAGVLCMDIDRLARGDSADQARVSNTFRISRTLIITPARVYDQTRESDEEYVDFELFMARREYKAISRRIMRGRIAAAGEGHFIGSTPPFGYDRVKVKKGRGYTLSPNAESDAVRAIFAMCIGGMGCAAIARRLDEMGLLPRRGGAWSGASVRDILKNPVYCGKIRWQYRREEKSLADGVTITRRRKNACCIMAQGLHSALVSGEDFDRAQQCLNTRRMPHSKDGTELRNPLAGLIYCGMCGGMMTRAGAGGKNRSEILRCPNRGCKNVSAKLAQVERALAEGVAQWLGGCCITVGGPQRGAAQAELLCAEKARAELEKLSVQRGRIYTFLEQGVYSPEEFAGRIAALDGRREKLSESLRRAEEALGRARQEQAACARQPRSERVMDIYEKASPEEKNRLLKTIVSRAVYIKTERNTRSNADRCGFSLNIVPLFPQRQVTD